MYYSGKISLSEMQSRFIKEKASVLPFLPEVPFLPFEEVLEFHQSGLAKRLDLIEKNTIFYTSTSLNDFDASRRLYLFHYEIRMDALHFSVTLKESTWIIVLGAYVMVIISIFSKLTQGAIPIAEMLMVVFTTIFAFRLAKNFADEMVLTLTSQAQ